MLEFIPLSASSHPSIKMAALEVEQLEVEHWLLNPESPISSQRRAHALRYHRQEDRQRALGATLIIDHLLQTHHLSEKEMEYGEDPQHHKPYFLHHPHLHFNLSHSGKYAVGALAPFPIGIDIEKIVPYSEGVARLCMSHEEIADMYTSTNDAGLDQNFITAWCMKEALLKAVGIGIGEDFFPKINFKGSQPTVSDPKFCHFTTKLFQIEDYMGAIAYRHP